MKQTGKWKLIVLVCASFIFNFQFSIFNSACAQAPGTTPVKVSHEMQMLHGRKYYVHIVEKGQTVYSIAKAYKVEAYDAVTHVDIHFMHAGDTVWLPARGQFSAAAEEMAKQKAEAVQPVAPEAPVETSATETVPATVTTPGVQRVAPSVRKPAATLKVALMMPLYLSQIDEISTSKFDIEQRGKKSYRQFEFIEFYEGIQFALDELDKQGISVELNVVDVSENSSQAVETAFISHRVAQSDFIVALLFRESFDKAAELAQQAGVYIVNPMATRSELCVTNPYMVKIQPSIAGQVSLMLKNMKVERPDAHLYIIHSNAKAEKPMLEELKRQLDERKDIRYTIFNWSQSAKLAATLKATPACNVVSIYDQGRDNNRVFVSNLLNRLSAFKNNSPTLYSFSDWTRDYSDIDYAQLQQLNYHTFYSSWDMTNQVHVDFLKAFRERYGSEPTNQLAATGHDLMLYIVSGLKRRGTDFWTSPTNTLPSLIQPLHLNQSGMGLENDRSQLYRLDSLRFVPASLK